MFPLFMLALAVLALIGCSSRDSGPAEPTGRLELPLAITSSGITHRFLGTIHVRNAADGSLAAAVASDAASPNTHSVALLPGAYTIEVVEGYSCSVDPDDASFTGCTYTGANPDPFSVAAGISTQVLLSFTFHFDEDVGVVFRTGEAQLILVPVPDTACEAACVAGELCVSIDGAEPSCAAACESNDDCGRDQACFALSSRSQRVCARIDPVLWTRQFGSSSYDSAESVSVDPSGNVLVAGSTSDMLPGQGSSGLEDVFISKLDGNGGELWTWQFGTSGSDRATSVSADASGDFLVAGSTSGALSGQSNAGLLDVFLSKHDGGSGNMLWIRQFGTSNSDSATSVSVDASGNVVVAGSTSGTLPGQSSAGGTDVFVCKLDSGGSVLWIRQFGGSSDDQATSTSVDASGNVLVAGQTWGNLPDQSSAGTQDAFVRKLDSNGDELWTWQFGTSSSDWATSVSADASGNLLVAGATSGTLSGQSSAGGVDAFVLKLDGGGNVLWTRQFGTSNNDTVSSVHVDGSGDIVVAGITAGTLPGQSSAGGIDVFVNKLDGDGNVLWTRQFGSGENDVTHSVGSDVSGYVFVAGETWGSLPGQSSAGSTDGFVMKLAP